MFNFIKTLLLHNVGSLKAYQWLASVEQLYRASDLRTLNPFYLLFNSERQLQFSFCNEISQREH